jgi:hypothetical protein
LSGLDFPEQWSLSFVELLPFYRSQHGLVGHLLGGWSLSGTYIISSGQNYTPAQLLLNTYTGGTAYDSSFDLTDIGTFDTARPFLLTPSAPASQVAIYGGDLCAYSTVLGAPAGCSGSPSQLYSWNAFNANGALQTVSANQARFLVNGAYADSVYNQPWGNVARNSLRDAITNRGNFGIAKDTNITERVKMRVDAASLNVFNHPNFGSVDPFIEDAGYTGEAHGFALPSLTSGGDRLIKFGVKVLF